MLPKAVAIAVVAALAEQATASSVHRHLHAARDAAVADKRDTHIHWVTELQTVTVVAGQAAAAPSNNPPAVQHKQVENAEVQEPANVVVEPTQPAPEPEAPQPTTMATKVKAKPSKTKSAKKNKPTAAPSSGDATFAHKRGLAYNNADLANMFGNTCGDNCAWAHNWGSAPDGLNKGISFVPTLWGNKEEFTGNWHENCQAALDAGAKAIFSFNEPDHVEQANIPDAGEAAASHAEWLGKYHGEALIGSPAVTNGGDEGMGIDYLTKFMSACDATDGCEVDFCNVHWYSQPAYADTLFDHLEAAHKACGGKPVWLTEFAPIEASDEQKSQFMEDVLPQLEKLEYLHAYSYFWVDEALVSPLKSITGFGELYASL